MVGLREMVNFRTVFSNQFVTTFVKPRLPVHAPPTPYTHLHPHTVPPNDLLAFESCAGRPSRLSLSRKQTSFDGTLKTKPDQVKLVEVLKNLMVVLSEIYTNPPTALPSGPANPKTVRCMRFAKGFHSTSFFQSLGYFKVFVS